MTNKKHDEAANLYARKWAIMEALKKAPRLVIWNVGHELSVFHNEIELWQFGEEFYQQTVTELIEYIADKDSAASMLAEYCNGVRQTFGDDETVPFPIDFLVATVHNLGSSMIQRLDELGLYAIKGFLLYKISHFLPDRSIVLEKVSVEDMNAFLQK